MEMTKAIFAEHAAFCNLGQEVLYGIDPEGDREYAIIERLFAAYVAYKESILDEDSYDEWQDTWLEMDDHEKFETIEEETL